MVFGALHAGGGRNGAFAAWAGAVGCLYGACAVATVRPRAQDLGLWKEDCEFRIII